MSPEEIKAERIRKKLLARFRFKQLVRNVIANRVWLAEYEETALGDNVRRNVEIIVRRKGVKGLLTIQERKIMSTRQEWRTEEQKRQIVKIITSLKCFANYQPVVRARLANVTHFQYFQQGRTIIREGHHANTMYFILDGEITVSRKKYSKLYDVWNDEPLAALGPGDVFGHVALLQDSKRTVTCVTAIDTELLCLYKPDFDNILRDILKVQWDQVKLSLQRFDYFRNWTNYQIEECCILAKIRQFSPLQTIYAEDKGQLDFAFFVLSGKCVILQCLKMNYNLGDKKKHYKLDDIVVVDKTASEDIVEQINKAAHGQRKSIAFGLETLEHFRSLRSSSEKRESNLKREQTGPNPLDDLKCQDIEFVEVGNFSCGAVFGLGEEMEHRTIVAKNYVQCLMIPRYWLFQKNQNVGNVWQRTKMYLNSVVPSRRKIFEDFNSTNLWTKYKRNLVEELHREMPVKNSTTVHDVPLICRIDEGF